MVSSNALPTPDEASLARSDALRSRIAAEITAKGFIGLDRFIEMALYTPTLGYYSSNQRKFGAEGDFITAPMLGDTFARAVFAQSRQWQARFGLPCHWQEFGAGNGQLAADILRLALEDGLSKQNLRYTILELSADLAAEQKERIAKVAPAALACVQWVKALPEHFEGVVLSNEVLDAMPVQVFEQGSDGKILEIGVGLESGVLCEASRDADGVLTGNVEKITQARGQAFTPGYRSELCTRAQAWIASLGQMSGRFTMLLVDYGFDQAQYYAPERSTGTLMAHYRHRAHADVLQWPGLQDITAHVDFSAIWLAASLAGLELLGYVNQANFLMNCDALKAIETDDPLARAKHHQEIQKLTAESEMGELFKVIAFAKLGQKDLENETLWLEPSLGFRRGERSGWL